MPSIEETRPATAVEFQARLLHFINVTLPRLDRRGKTWSPVSADTELFAGGLLDSLSILHLICAVEELTGRPVPDRLVLMKHFQSVDALTAAFWQSPLTDHL
jgi:acyl carrier protein